MTSAPTSATYRRRVLSAAVDLTWAAVPVILTAPLVLNFWLSGGGESQLAALFVIVANAALGIVVWVAIQLYAAARRRPTPGRKLASLTVVRADGTPAGAGRSLARAALALLTVGGAVALALPALVALGPVSALLPADRRAFWDRATGTFTVDAQASEASAMSASSSVNS